MKVSSLISNVVFDNVLKGGHDYDCDGKLPDKFDASEATDDQRVLGWCWWTES